MPIAGNEERKKMRRMVVLRESLVERVWVHAVIVDLLPSCGRHHWNPLDERNLLV